MAIDGVTLRAIEEADAEAVCALAQQLGYQRSVADVLQWIRSLPERALEQAAFVAVVDGAVVGWIDVSITWMLQSARSAKINGLVVAEHARGRGLGRILCAQAEAWAAERGVSRVWVTSNAVRESAHRFYLRDGYRRVKTSAVFEKML